MHSSLVKDWDNQTLEVREERAIALRVVASSIGDLSNAKQDSTAAFLAVLNMMEKLHQLLSSNRHIVSIPAMFTTSWMNLLGENIVCYSIRDIISHDIANVMASYYNNDIPLNSNAFAQTYLDFKMLLDSAGKEKDKISPSNATRLHDRMRKLYINGSQLINLFQRHMKVLINGNRPADAKRFLAYLELYAKLETVRLMALTHMLSLIPENSTGAINFILSSIQKVKKASHDYFIVIHNPYLQSKFVAYFDSQVYKVTNAYMDIQLALQTASDHYPGLSCIALFAEMHLPWKWFNVTAMNHAYFERGTISTSCKWRVLHHDQNLYSIVNKYDCPNGPWCDAMLSFDDGNPPSVTIKHNDPVLWEIINNPFLKKT